MSGFNCSFCALKFPGQEEIRAHVLSPEHARKVKEANLDSFVQGPTKSSTTNMSFRCEPCGKRFEGRIPYDQHLASEKHLKKIRSVESGGSNTPAQGENYLYCEPCGKKFAGQVPYDQHVISARHIKKMRESGSMSSLITQSPQATKPSCPLCNLSFESPQSLLEHTSSQEHRIRSLLPTEKGGSVTKPTPEEKEDRDLLIHVIANYKRDFLVCPADMSFMDFVSKHKIFA